MTLATPALPLADLEQVYDHLAEALDRTPEGRSELFLVKLALLLAQDLGDRARFEQQVAVALRDL
jgi:hypothetical protein